MTLIDTDRAHELYGAMGTGIEMSGGSAANTMTGIASFGGRVAYIGKVADDQLGDVFGHDLRAVGVTFEIAPLAVRCEHGPLPHRRDAGRPADDEHLPRRVVAAQPGRRGRGDGAVGAASSTWRATSSTGRSAKEAYFKAAALAHKRAGKVSLTLSDSFCVDRHRDDFFKLVDSEVDMLFANEDELMALYQVDDFDDALQAVRGHCEIAAITRERRPGRWWSPATSVHVIDAHPVDDVVDTTGAGDLYAAGFLYGFTHDHSLADCGRLGSLAAAEVISHVGARPLVSLRACRPAG